MREDILKGKTVIPKYKAWDKKLKEMLKVVNINFDEQFIRGLAEVETNLDIESSYKFDEIELLQSTGLKDKNGIEIYEGDVVKNEYNELGYIKWSRGGFVYHEDGANFYLFSIGAGQPFEVVGNIYQPPHILEEN